MHQTSVIKLKCAHLIVPMAERLLQNGDADHSVSGESFHIFQ